MDRFWFGFDVVPLSSGRVLLTFSQNGKTSCEIYEMAAVEARSVLDARLSSAFGTCCDSRRAFSSFGYMKNVCDVLVVRRKSLEELGVVLGSEETTFLEALRKQKVHLEACFKSRIDVERVGLDRAVPLEIVRQLAAFRARISLLSLPSDDSLVDFCLDETMPLAAAVYDIEKNGIAMADGSVARTRYVVDGTRTGRLSLDSGFNTMGIRHGLARRLIVSRFPGGKICSVDYNAIDYRCIVSSVNEARSLYSGCSDFHERTAELVSGKTRVSSIRESIKQFTYACMYGGSLKTCAKQAKISDEAARAIVSVIESKLSSVIEFREQLAAAAQKSGLVETPFGRNIPVSKEDHPGKVLGLYAQTYSSWVFGRALVAVQNIVAQSSSLVLFPLHDEIVIDLHPSDGSELVWRIVDAMETVSGGIELKAKASLGESYGELERMVR